jgi:3-methyladenine DNA glycosylase AlkD
MSNPGGALNLEAAVSTVVFGLAAKASAENAVAMQGYMKTDMPSLGVMSRGRREVFKALKGSYAPSTLEEYEALVMHLWALPHKEEKYIGLAVAAEFREFITPASLPMYSRLIREGAWWDFVDGVAVHCVGVALRAHRAEVEPAVREWIDHGCSGSAGRPSSAS